jgi:hypothetical protein
MQLRWRERKQLAPGSSLLTSKTREAVYLLRKINLLPTRVTEEFARNADEFLRAAEHLRD